MRPLIALPHTARLIRLALVALGVAAPPLSAQTAPLSGVDPAPPAACTSGDVRIPVLLVGTYHMANPGLDGFNLEADDVLLPRRQREIEATVEALARFKPTRVLVEEPADQPATNERYRRHLAGVHELTRNEVEQIGFRLAREMGHEAIYPVDVELKPDQRALGELVGTDARFGELMGGLQQYGQGAMRTLGRWLAEGSVGEMLYRMNTPAALAWAHEIYIRYFPLFVAEENYAGADHLATWYQRNLRIFSNFHRAAQASHDRLLVIYGQGHVPILRQLVVESPWFCIEDPLVYLAAVGPR